MTPGGSSREALGIGSALLTEVGPFFPVRLTLTGDELDFTLVLRQDIAAPGRPLTDVMRWVELRSGVEVAGHAPRFSVDASGPRELIRVELAGSAVRALIVLPERAAKPDAGRWQDQVPTTLTIAMEEIARVLTRCRHEAGGAELLIDLELGYRPYRDFEARLAAAHEPVRGFVPPVRPVLCLRWRSATSVQRKAFVENLAEVTPVGRWPRRRLAARLVGLDLELPA
jgi:hypothetical protein